MTENTGRVGDSTGGVTEDRLTTLHVLTVLLQFRHMLLLLPLIGGIAVGFWSISQNRQYTSTASFIPRTPASRLGPGASLARQFGMQIGSESQGQSPQFYADLLKTEGFLRQAVEAEYVIQGDDEREIRRTLVDHYQIASDKRGTPAWRLALETLDKNISVATEWETGVVTLTVTDKHPQVAEQVTAYLLTFLNDFNEHMRRSRAKEEERFIAERLTAARQELSRSENELLGFLQRNRLFQNAPELVFEHERLQREVASRQQVVTSLEESYEQARIDAVRDTPVITIIQTPAGFALPKARGTIFRSVLAASLCLLIAILLAFGIDFNRRMSGSEAIEQTEFDMIRKEAVAELRSLTRWFRRRKPPVPA